MLPALTQALITLILTLILGTPLSTLGSAHSDPCTLSKHFSGKANLEH